MPHFAVIEIIYSTFWKVIVNPVWWPHRPCARNNLLCYCSGFPFWFLHLDMKIFFLPLLLVTSLALSKQIDKNPIKHVSQIDSTLLKLKDKKAAVDRYIAKHDKTLIVLVKIPGKNNLIRVKNEN